MSIVTDPLLVSSINYDQDTCNCEGCYYNNQIYTDYPSPVSSPDFSEISENQAEIKSCNDNSPYYSDTFEYCDSPSSITENEDIEIEIDLNNDNNTTTSKRSYTNMNNDDIYTNPTTTNNNKTNNKRYPRCFTPTSPVNSMSSLKTSRKRSYSEVEDTSIFSNIDSMNEEDIDTYLNNIDFDLFPKVKSSSELLIFSPLAMKRFKLSNRSKQNNHNYQGEECNSNYFDSENIYNTPRIVELSDDEDISQYSSQNSVISNHTSTPLYPNSCQSFSVSSEACCFNVNSSPFMSYQQQQQQESCFNNHISSLQV
ncbi:hypothetical protein BCR32DRAFT_271234 [Anaeromyces robustus]|uniref:Uncharacterized protein n=1 Tax=Anaeromyces robustus TaxID=1754192 RepID=A0A1Y1WSK6_9FUNG|nr:hypothetical protein BCR32DRAFT_271234 [Anaeromyces robustus]|eukprot:ORX76521.1 hypothetical protein BCR32DRAFT_271234 [Anaeromyces robustus]